MKKTNIYLLLFLIVAVLSSCGDNFCTKGKGTPEERLVYPDDTISSISLHGSGDLYVTIGDYQEVRVRIRPNLFDRLNTHVSNGLWEVKFDECVTTSKFEAYVTVRSLHNLKLIGSGDIIMHNAVSGDKFTVSLDGSGDIKANANVNNLVANLDGSGDLSLSGNANTADLDLKGSGDISGFGMKCITADAYVNGSGDLEVSVSETLHAKINGSGDIIYDGNPGVYSDITGSGKVSRR